MAQKATKNGTVAERVTWMSRTSDIHGSHMKTDLESYLTLIRRKIQEKCATTVELMTTIRRFKIGESGHVTPNEFRFTLIKFGIILPQPLVDRVFNVFDSDRSGTMDFDEFAMWIMNSEFRPAMKHKKVDETETPEYQLRKKLQRCQQEFPRVFQAMKKQVSFLEFVSDINRTGMPLTEREARTIFQLLDPTDSGYIQSAMFTTYAETGKVVIPTAPMTNYEHTSRPGALKEIINRVVGRNTRQLEDAFSHIKIGQHVKLPFEEFRRCVLNGGVGRNMADFRELFMALGGAKENLADVDLFFATISPILVDPATEVSKKKSAPPVVSTSRADRHLRDAIRKSYKEVKADIEKVDTTGSGYISAEALYKVLVKRCMPLTFQDFRFIVQQIHTEPGTDRIDHRHFLHGYNPSIPPHQLSGLSTLKSYDDHPAAPSNNHHSHHHGNNQSSSTATTNTSVNLAASAPSPFRLTALQKAQKNPKDDIGVRSSKTFSTTSLGGSVMAENPELRRIWQNVLRECHRADPERTGQINRNTFIAAIERGDLGKSMSAEQISGLADKYALSNGLVNYLLLFRNYLQDMTGTNPATFTQQPAASQGLHKSQSLPHGLELPLHHEHGAVHPWEFDYKRTRHMDPYWHSATSHPKDHEIAKNMSTTILVPSAATLAKEMASTQERDTTLAKYDPATLALFANCYRMFAPVWRPLRNDFKKAQVPTQKGNILATHFITVLESHGITVSKKDLGVIIKNFRGIGMQDIVKYDEFLRVCMMMKENA